MSSSIRQERVAALLLQELSIIVSSELDDPAISLVEVTNVVVTKDLRTAKVYVHHRDEEVSVRALLKALKRATPYVRGQIAERCGLRMVPDVYFHYDDTPSRSARVDELLRQLAAEKAAAPDVEAKAESE